MAILTQRRDKPRDAAQAGNPRAADEPPVQELVSALSHDLRSPLNSIIGFSEILLSERVGGLNAEQKKELAAILRRGGQLLRLLDRLVDYCKDLGTGARDEGRTAPLGPLLENAAAGLRHGGVRAEIRVRPCPGALRAAGNAQRIQAVLEELVEAAGQHVRPRAVEIGAEPRGERVVVRIVLHGGQSGDPGTWSAGGLERLPGRVRFALHLARYYVQGMGGDLSVRAEGDRLEFQLAFRKDG